MIVVVVVLVVEDVDLLLDEAELDPEADELEALADGEAAALLVA